MSISIHAIVEISFEFDIIPLNRLIWDSSRLICPQNLTW
uniref:Uncharacterized protein n=1 Tax=Rhizophora mucronata TaxID=61149 RepID=A0A2P2QTZ2_RHIMU